MMFGISQPVLDLFEPTPEALLPCCHICGGHGDLVTVNPAEGIPTLRAASLFALLEIAEHVHQEHPGAVR